MKKMRQMKSKLLAVILPIVLAAAVLTGCSDSVKTGGNAQTANDATATEQPENGTEAEVVLLLRATYTDADGVSYVSFAYEYDAKGNETKYTDYGSDGSMEGWIEKEYDARGNEMKRTHYGSAGGINYAYEYEYITITLEQ